MWARKINNIVSACIAIEFEQNVLREMKKLQKIKCKEKYKKMQNIRQIKNAGH